MFGHSHKEEIVQSLNEETSKDGNKLYNSRKSDELQINEAQVEQAIFQINEEENFLISSISSEATLKEKQNFIESL